MDVALRLHRDDVGLRVGRGRLVDAPVAAVEVVELAGSDLRLTLPLDACTLSFGGVEGTTAELRCTTLGTTLLVDDRGFVEALAASGRFPEVFAAQSKRARGRRWFDRTALGVVGVVAALCGAALLAAPRFAEGGIDRVPRSVDQSIGDAAATAMRASQPVVTDPVVLAGVEAALAPLRPLAREAGYDLSLTVLDDPTWNASALPGGPVFVHVGLVAACERPELLTAVLAHELAHVTERHGVERVLGSLGMVQAARFLLGDLDVFGGLLTDGASLLAVTAFSREQEAEADRLGVDALARAGVDPTAMADVFTLLRSQHTEADLSGVLAALSDHPDTEARIVETRRQAARHAAANRRPIEGVDWATVRAAAERALAAHPAR